jgi:hypothetical protein
MTKRMNGADALLSVPAVGLALLTGRGETAVREAEEGGPAVAAEVR